MIGTVLASVVVHRWKPTVAPHAALRSDAYVRSVCGRVEKQADVMRSNDGHRCAKCFRFYEGNEEIR